ncbi:hypothetical protein [Tateyamaria sp. SN3-11]|uniref:hypothetical protein n=1 Tax=Tateyamaria sp. SN3-11 TaxID=3092147 RepID=UPI0039EB9C30
MTENAYGRAPLLAAAQGTQSTLLHYALSTIPNPIQADRSASISISVTNPTNAAIDLQELKINLQNGRFPQDLSDGFSNVVTKASPGWTFGPSSSPGIFTVKPQTPQDGNITANSVVFVISSIPVNDQPGGPVPFVLTETTGPNGRIGKLTVGVNKAPPDFFLENVYGTPNLIDYDGSGTVHWKATPGATITLDFDGQVHRHVKGQPGDPLPATGSYSFDNLTTDKTVTVIANNPGSGSPRTLRKQVQLQLSVARIETLTATVSATPGTLPHVDIDWSAASATSATLSNSLAAVYRFVDPHSGTFQTPIAVQTDFTLSAENPAYPAPSHATVTATPPAMGWTKVNGGPSEPHFVQAMPNGLLSISVVSAAFSENGMDWIDVAFPIAQIGGQSGNPPQQLEQPIGTTARNNAAITMTRNIAVTGPAPHARQIMLTSSTDLETWTQPPTAPWATSIFPDASIVTAPTGDVFVFGATSTQNEVWCSKDGLKTWTKLASKVCGPPALAHQWRGLRARSG